MIDRELMKMILGGRCFAFIGAGPSVALGYPSWRRLAEKVYDAVQARSKASDKKSYEKFLEKEKYPELFKQAEIDLGSREELITTVKAQLQPVQPKAGHNLYSYLARWPFACYLTTNYDDEMQRALNDQGIAISVNQNRKSDFYLIRDGVQGHLWKIHSDLGHPDRIVLTSADYHRFYVSDVEEGFREKLRQIFEMFPVLMIGYSNSDPHISYILQIAKQTANPERPIYLIAADLSLGEIREYREHFNVRVIPYENPDNSHSGLRLQLQVVDRFVPSRKPVHALQTHPETEVEAATALHIARRLQYFGSAKSVELVSPLIRIALSQANGSGLTHDQLFKLPMLTPIAKSDDFRSAAVNALEALKNLGEVTEATGNFFLTDVGNEKLEGLVSIRRSGQRQALAQFENDMRAEYPELTSKQTKEAADLLSRVFVNVFRARGLAIASGVFAGQSVGSEDVPEIFGQISDAGGRFDDERVKYAFMEAVRRFLLEPSDAQRHYVAALSQGYFLYHLAGLDPHLTRFKKNVLTDAVWIIDSSVLIPLLASYCYHHEFVKDLVGRLINSGAKIYVTSSLLGETKEHLEWAANFIRTNPNNLDALLSVANVEPPYKQNLFVDGFIRCAADGHVKDFDEYLEQSFGKGVLHELFEEKISGLELGLLQIEDVDKMDELMDLIRNTRELRGTYRGEPQVRAEAEVLSLIRELRSARNFSKDVATHLAYFISHSRVLDQAFPEEGVVTWTPEALYRFVTSLPGEVVNVDLLQQCMLHEYFYAGVTFIDEERYVRFFGPVIQTARLKYGEEKRRYLEEVSGHDDEARLDREFEHIPDLQKPLFAVQMAWKVAAAASRRANILEEQARDLKEQVKKLEVEKDEVRKEASHREQNAARQRQLRDPKHQRKRARQAKKRLRKKRK